MKINTKRDGHVHSPFCPHGSLDTLDMYIEKALDREINEITFTEHMPLTLKKDPSPRNNSAMSEETLIKYLESIKILKEKYKDRIKINVGVEVDYLEGEEENIKTLLNKYGKYIDDSILSVHILKYNGKYYPIGSGVEELKKLVDALGSLEKFYNLYYETILKSIKCDLGKYKPKRIGHPTLVRKYKKDFQNEVYDFKLLEEIVSALKKDSYEIDLNTSGLRKEKCKEIYPTGIFMKFLVENKVPIVLGSDSHEAKDVGFYFNNVEDFINSYK
ncbi:MAG: histidinol-phosphatase HisJ [Clostridium perfringens]|nr:histidinol-phosphatase HisJ [Clostridium perfringens]